MMFLLAVGCLFDRATYLARLAELTDDDGDGVTEVRGDCDDLDAGVFPGALETCNEIDDDCDGRIDASDEVVHAEWYADADGDGFGGGNPVVTCDPPPELVAAGGDCDDTDAERFPGAPEACNGVDDDCDDVIDDDAAPLDWYPDGDGDGFGAGTPVATCADPGGASLADGDCDDTDRTVSPDATEVCNGVDDDCNGATDDAPAVTWFLDRDEDGYGDDDTTYEVCTPPPGYARLGGDCDDVDAERNPSAVEVCEDGSDGDCDGREATCGLAAGESAAEDMSARFSVATTEPYVARSVGTAGDLDGDGDDELAIARPGRNGLEGAVTLIPGQEELWLGDHDLEGEGAPVAGNPSTGAFGFAMSGGEDADGDGRDDLLVSALYEDRVYLFTDGPALLRGGLDASAADVIFVGPDADASFGIAVALLGDIDGDGFGDTLVGDYLYQGSGAAFLYYGDGVGGGREIGLEEAVVLRSSRADAQAGQELASVGDLDGDGLAEFAVGDNKVSSTGESSFAQIFFGDSVHLQATDLADAETVLEGDPTESAFAEIVGVGDVNGDGRDDAAFSSPGWSNASGAAFLLFGSVSVVSAGRIEDVADASVTGSREGLMLGAAVSGPGDLDGDGYRDVATGTGGASGAAGSVVVLRGAAGLGGAYADTDAWAEIEGALTTAEGDGLAGSCDVNGDGAADLVLSAWRSGATQGEAWLVYGAP